MTGQAKASRALRSLAPLAAAGCAAIAVAVVGRRRSLRRPDGDPADRHLAAEQMEALATAEGMPEAPGA
jgi:hypothetical protein